MVQMRFVLLALVLCFFSTPSRTEPLRQGYGTTPAPAQSSSGSPIRARRRAPTPQEMQAVEKARADSEIHMPAISFLLATPLIAENTFETRLGGIGNFIWLSLPLTQLGNGAALHAETGIGVSYVKVVLNQPATEFTHLYFLVPLYLRYVFTVSNSVFMDLVAGGIYRPFEYDSRPTADGGFHGNESTKKISADGGLGLTVCLSPNLRLRFLATYQFFSGGLQLRL